MTLHTTAQFELARVALESKTPKELAAFILSLSSAEDGIAQYIQMFAVSADRASLAELISAELATLRQGEREYDYRHRQGAGVVSRIDRLLDAIETIMLPVDTSGAFHALAQFIESDEEIGGNCHEDDFGASQAFDRACDLLLTIVPSLPAEQTEPILDRLQSRDDFGLRGKLTRDPSPTCHSDVDSLPLPD